MKRSVYFCLIATMLVFSANLVFAASNQQMIDEAKRAVRERLKDPESARFRNVRVTLTPNNSVWIKGEYNAKNAFGGYVGFEKFVYTTEEKHLVLESELKKNAAEDPSSVDGFIYVKFFVENW